MHLDKTKYVWSGITERGFEPVHNNRVLNCHTTNLVYVISCIKCKAQYVGLTGRQLKERFMEHRRDVLKNKKDSYILSAAGTFHRFCGVSHHFCSLNNRQMF